MELEFFQVDAFASKVFEGNPATVYPLTEWLPDATLQAIAAEHNLSETVFYAPENDGYRIRWFTPVAEVALCGHATLAAAHVILGAPDPDRERIHFFSRSGPLTAKRDNDRIVLDFPESRAEPCDAPAGLAEALGIQPVETLRNEDYFVVIDHEEALLDLNPDPRMLGKIDCRGICVTAPGERMDFVSRFFAPRHGIDEDPVTGSTHCALAPYWSNRLGKTELTARQLSKRGGTLWCRLENDRVRISGTAITYARGKAFL